MLNKIWIDPPRGWMYGFPAVWNKEEFPEIKDFLREHGYPEQDIGFAITCCRSWAYTEEGECC